MTEGPDRETLRWLGYPEPPELLEALTVPLERGHHLAVLAAEGSGKELLYAEAARLRCDPESTELQAAILTPTREAALRAATIAHVLAGPEGVACLAWPPEPGPPEEDAEAELPFAHLLAGRPDRLLAEVRAGRLGLGGLRLLVLDGVVALEETGGWASVEALIDTLEPETQRIAVAEALGPRLAELLEGRLPRARRWPPELFPEAGLETARAGEEETADEAATRPVLRYATAVGEMARLERLAAGLRILAAEVDAERAVVHCPDEDAARRAAAYLAVAGFRLAGDADPDAPGLVVAWGEDEPPPRGVGARFGLPPGLESLRSWLGDAAARLVVVEERHLGELRLLARRAGWRLSAVPARRPEALEDAVARFRAEVERGARAADPAVELLLLEPLLEELGSARVTAALASLLRKAPRADTGERARGPRPAEPLRPRMPAPGGEPEVPRRRVPRRPTRTERAVRPAWTRIWISVGQRDGAGPGDLVGAITGETPAVGAQIGKIDVRSSYSLVDLDSQVVDEVLRGLEGASIKGRDVHARVARED